MGVDNEPTKVRMVRGRPLRDTDPMPYRKGSASRIRETIRDAMLPEDTVAAMSGTPAERREDEAAAAARRRLEETYIKRNDGGIARKTRVF